MNEKALDHVDLFHKLAAPLPKTAYKDLKLGGRTMTVIDAYHIISRLTQVFGLAGYGWGGEVDEFSFGLGLRLLHVCGRVSFEIYL